MKARRVFGVSSAWCLISRTDAGGSTGVRMVVRAGTAVASRREGVGSVFCHEKLPYPLWVLGVLLCTAPAFSQRREGRAEVRDDAVCVAVPARHGIYGGVLSFAP